MISPVSTSLPLPLPRAFLSLVLSRPVNSMIHSDQLNVNSNSQTKCSAPLDMGPQHRKCSHNSFPLPLIVAPGHYCSSTVRFSAHCSLVRLYCGLPLQSHMRNMVTIWATPHVPHNLLFPFNVGMLGIADTD